MQEFPKKGAFALYKGAEKTITKLWQTCQLVVFTLFYTLKNLASGIAPLEVLKYYINNQDPPILSGLTLLSNLHSHALCE